MDAPRFVLPTHSVREVASTPRSWKDAEEVRSKPAAKQDRSKKYDSSNYGEIIRELVRAYEFGRLQALFNRSLCASLNRGTQYCSSS